METRWYQYLLHNQRATGLKAALLLRGDSRVVVINVPWYLGETALDPMSDDDSKPPLRFVEAENSLGGG